MTNPCSNGVVDCAVDDSGVCAPYNNAFTNPSDLHWLVPLAAIFMCTNAFGVGANDVANAWGTSVASGAVGLRKACIVAGLMNIIGAVTLGYGVSDTIQQGVADIDDPNCWACGYCNSRMTIYAIGMFGALIGSSIFLGLSTFSSLPVSGTHAVVGGVVGMTMVGTSASCLRWGIKGGLGGIMLSWVLSPVVAGIIGAGLYVFTNAYIFKSFKPRKRSLMFMPIFVGSSIFLIVFLVLLKSKVTKKALPIWAHFLLSAVAGLIGYVGGYIFRQRVIIDSLPSLGFARGGDHAEIDMHSQIGPPGEILSEIDGISEIGNEQGKVNASEAEKGEAEAADKAASAEIHSISKPRIDTESIQAETKEAGEGKPGDVQVSVEPKQASSQMDEDKRDAQYVFKYLLVFNAALESFAHGANDTGNAAAPFSAVYYTVDKGLSECNSAQTPEWVLLVAGLCVALGVNSFGYRVMKTVGEKITIVDFHKGFCIEFASTAAVVIATLLSFPVSTTHCQIGAVVAVGWVSMGYRHVKFSQLGMIGLSWLITLPFSGLCAATMTAMMRAGEKG